MLSTRAVPGSSGISGMTVPQLRALLRANGLPTSGTRAMLIARIAAAQQQRGGPLVPPSEEHAAPLAARVARRQSRPTERQPARVTARTTLAEVFHALPILDQRAQQPSLIDLEGREIVWPRAARRTAYVPMFEPIERETLLQQKFGGHAPLFLAGDHWPTTDDLEPAAAVVSLARNAPLPQPLAFVAQFVEPHNTGYLVQLFFPDIDSEQITRAYLRFLPLERTSTASISRIEIPEPPNVPRNAYLYDTPEQIFGWMVRDEPSPEWLEAAVQAAFPDVDDEQHLDALIEQAYRTLVPQGRVDTVKIDGYGDSRQDITYALYIQNLYNGDWGESGVLHVAENGTVQGDMAS